VNSPDDIRAALSHVDSHDRDTWVRMGMAVKSELGDAGFGLWDAWSQQADNYQPRAAMSVWRSIRPSGPVTIATLIAVARANGWNPGDKINTRRFERKHDLRHAEAERDALAENAARRAQELLESATPGGHAYLKEKGFHDAEGLVLPDSALFVPMRNWKTNALQGAQIIRADGDAWGKKMIHGMRAKGAVLRLGNGREAILCEGYATGLSIEMAARRLCLSASVLICFSAGNLAHVGSLLSGRRYAFADNDPAGIKAAQGLPYCMSEIVGNDANDDHQQFGLMSVTRKLMEVRRSQA